MKLPPAYIKEQPPERQALLSQLHNIIINGDKTVTAKVEPMMGKEMIIYYAPGTFKYGLSSVKNYMSLHVMPIYCTPALHTKYKELLNKAHFQKGCINFINEEEIPPKIVKQLISDCAKIDLRAVKLAYEQSRKK